MEILDLDPEFFVLWLNNVSKAHGVTIGDLNIILTSDNYLLKLNNEYLNHDYFTDIITFNYNEAESVNGDLFISYDRVIDNSKEFNVSRETELNRVIVHGVLHLIGYNDKTSDEQLIMKQKEKEALDLIVSRET